MNMEAENKLIEICREFINHQQLGHAESVWQSDIDHGDICQFLVKVCDHVGYWQNPEED